ncbi:bifunctional glycosyltransferase/CDP-glycerol:glycerophosphate glycerophosphotransferase [Mycoplasma sp. P36-A1]|uniref:bifunctional glycosyltransferase/CDP-glycerol:glycerophosphate glycerophosphotransferase n=1 Tax=Mycoplasma sp. P36-A1 TaxID=3252900 RepID=UPI003C2E6114
MVEISIIVPFYNVKEFLFEALESLTKQELQSNTFEVIMIDDGSTDGSKEIAEYFANTFHEFRLIVQENRGLGAARNIGESISVGKYIIFFDSDDIIPNGTYKIMLEKIRKTKSDFVTINVKRFMHNVVKRSPLHEKIFRKSIDKTNIENTPELIYDSTAWNKLILHSWYKTNNFKFPENMLYEDIPVTMVMHYLANSIDIIYEIGYLWRERDNSNQSITQNRVDIVNFQDRKKAISLVLNSIDKLQIKRKFLDDFLFKSLSLDLPIYFKVFPYVNNKYKTELIEFAKKLYNLMSIDYTVKLPYRNRIEYGLIFEEKFNELSSYELDKNQGVLHFEETTNNDIFAMENKYTRIIQNFDVHPKSTDFFRNTIINNIDLIDNQLTISFHNYFSALNTNDLKKYSAQLEILNSNNKIVLEKSVKIMKDEEFTYEKGYVKNQPKREKPFYNYDYSLFEVIIPFESIDNILNSCEAIKFRIKIHIKGLNFSFILQSANCKKWVTKHFVSSSNVYKLTNDEDDNILIARDTESLVIDSLSVYKKSNHYKLSLNGAISCGKTNIGISRKSEILYAEKIKNSKYYFDIENTSILEKNGRYLVYDTEGENKIISKNSSSYFYNTETKSDGNYVMYEYRSKLFIEKYKSQPILNKIIFDEATLNFNLNINRKLIFSKRILRSSYMIFSNDSENIEMKINLMDNPDNRNEFLAKIAYNDFTSNISSFDVYLKLNYLLAKPKLLRVRFGVEGENKIHRLMGKTIILYPYKNEKFNNLKIEIKRNNGFMNKKEYSLFLDETYVRKYKNLEINEKKFFFIINSRNMENYKLLKDEIIKNNIDNTIIFCSTVGFINGENNQVVYNSKNFWYELSTCKYIFTDNNLLIDYYKKDKQIIISLEENYGITLKGVNDTISVHESKKDIIRKKYDDIDFLLSVGEHNTFSLKSAFQSNVKILETAIPYFNNLNKSINENILIRKKFGIPDNSKVVILDMFEKSKRKVIFPFRAKHLLKMTNDDVYFVIFCEKKSTCSITNKDLGKRGRVIYNLSNMTDYMNISEALVTDYSPSFLGYSTLNKPIIFFQSDQSNFDKNIAKIDKFILKNLPGKIITSENELFFSINNLDKLVFASNKNFENKFLSFNNANISERIIDLIVKEEINNE